jgi:hypothetical protein
MNNEHVRQAEMHNYTDETSSTTSTPKEGPYQEEGLHFSMNNASTTKRKKRGLLGVMS